MAAVANAVRCALNQARSSTIRMSAIAGCAGAQPEFFSPYVGVPNASLTWTHDAPGVFESSAGHERDFYRVCGTPLFFRLADGERTSLMIGAFDDPTSIPLCYEFGIESRAGQLDALGKVEAYTAEELMPEGAARIRVINRQFQPE